MGLEHAIPLASYIFMPFDGSQLGLVFQPSSDLASALESPPASAAMFSHQAWTSPRLPVELLGTEKATSTASAVNLAFGIQLILDSHLSHLYCNGIHHSCGDMNEDLRLWFPGTVSNQPCGEGGCLGRYHRLRLWLRISTCSHASEGV